MKGKIIDKIVKDLHTEMQSLNFDKLQEADQLYILKDYIAEAFLEGKEYGWMDDMDNDMVNIEDYFNGKK
jgi:hypothetical protein